MKLRKAISAMTLLGLGAFHAAPCAAQSAKPTDKTTPPDYSNQAVVVEYLGTSAIFRDDGTSTLTRSARIKIQSQAGVQEFGLLQFPYASATTTAHVNYVRVIRPDKSVVTTPAENTLDMPADITRQAPFYSDLKDLQVAVKGLEIGDVLEFETHAETTKPLDPGQFWNSFNFMRNAIVLSESLKVSVPGDRKVVIKSATAQPKITESGGNRIYTWETSNLSLKTDHAQSSSDDAKLPDVQVTSFQSWDEVGKWFGGLVAPRAAPTPEIKAKADELTRGAKSDAEKLQDLYAFVATKYRYIGIGLGIGRYQPHAAADVLTNDYGDCKDKHTLLEALLAAEGIKAYPALVNSSAKIDVDVPSPLQFDHVITVIPQGEGFLFLDTTPEVGPFGYLTASVRDKWALVIPDSGAAHLVKTPADPPFHQFFHFQADTMLDDSGRLTGKMQLTFRDDSELIFRLAFRQGGESQWNDVMQKISGNLGFGGKVSNVTITQPDDTATPFHIAYDYKRENYSDWADKQITPPFPPIYIPPVPDDAAAKTKPIKLGSPEETEYVANIELPADAPPNALAAVHLSTPFGSYDATYTYTFAVSGGTLHVERKLVTKVREVAPANLEAYGKFEKAIEDDEKGYIRLNGAQSQNWMSDNPEAQKLFNEGYQSWQMRDFPGAMDYLQRAVEIDPKFAQAWLVLGSLHGALGPRDQAIDELKKAIALNPKQPAAYNALGTLLMYQHEVKDALAVWKDMEKAAPDNATAPERIGSILLSLKRYSDAVSELEGAVKRNLNNSTLLIQLGTAYANSGDGTKAILTFENAVRNDPSANTLNSVAYAMADANLNLTEALQDAQKAVSEEEAVTAKIDIDHADPQDFATPSLLAAYWDTLGWAYYRSGDLGKAEKYLNAGWHLSQAPTIADHLGQVFEKEGKKQEAIKAYDGAEATGHAPDHSQTRLDALGGRGGYDTTAPSIQGLRMTRVPFSPKPKDHASADFVVALSPGGKVLTRFVSGSEELRDAGKALAAAKFDLSFPDDGPLQILRRGILDCEPELKQCSFAMYPLSYPQQLQTNSRPAPENAPGATVLKLRPGAPSVVVKRGGGTGQGDSKSPQ
jgi:tetratricopeptide (TPR) repeat protein